MKPKQLGLELSRQEQISRAAAQDEVDELVAGLIKKLRAGEPVKLPGVGSIVPSETATKAGKPQATERRRRG